MADQTVRPASASYWDDQADAFDAEADHGLRQPEVRAAWLTLLRRLLVPAPARLVDIGCGTGTLGVLLAGVGYEVDGVDFSPRMVDAASAKARSAGVQATFRVADAHDPRLPTGRFDIVLVRHVLWALVDQPRAVRAWFQLLKAGGRLVLIEGRWSTGAGLGLEEVEALVARHGAEVATERLDDPALWGGRINDERFVVAASC